MASTRGALPGSPGHARPRLVPLYRLYHPDRRDHFYTASASERSRCLQHEGYLNEDVAGSLLAAPVPGALPLHRLRHLPTGHRLSTVSPAVCEAAIRSGRYEDEGMVGYAFGAEAAGLVPLYALYELRGGDHFYTTSAAKRDAALAHGYLGEGVACYLPDPAAPPN